MAISQRIVWTVLPNGFGDSGNPRVSIFVQPQLMSNAPKPVLGDFGDFLNWPKTLVGMTFKLKVGATTIPLKPAGLTPDAELWSKLFPSNTFVRPFAFPNYHTRFIHSYPIKKVVDFVRDTYGQIAADAQTERPNARGSNQNPALKAFIDTVGPVSDYDRKKQGGFVSTAKEKTVNGKKLRAVNSNAPGDYSLPNSNKGVTQLAFLQAHRFFNRPENHPMASGNTPVYHRSPAKARAAGLLPPPRPKLPDVDFHQMLVGLGDYALMLRRLGMVLDFELTAPLPSPTGDIQLLAPWGGGGHPAAFNADTFPITKYESSGKLFLPKPKSGDSEMGDGMLHLENPKMFDVIQIDPDSASHKTLQFANNMERLQKPEYRSYAIPDEEGLATLRTAGFALIRHQRALRTVGRLDAVALINKQVELGTTPTMWGDDLMRGYRIEIWDDVSKQWHSVSQRIERLRLPAAGLGFEDNAEAIVKTTSGTTAHDGSSDDLYLDETLVTWEGWSLGASRPGRVIDQKKYDDDGKPLEYPIVTPMVNPPKKVPGFDLEEQVRVAPGTLPRLRFGRSYRMRARIVDFAGNSIPLDLIPDNRASALDKFLRHEPLSSPTLLPNDVFREGESLEHLVIRSNFNKTAVEYSTLPYIIELLAGLDTRFKGLNGGIGFSYKGFNERHVLPPKVSVQMAELHGEFDKAMGPGGNPAKYYHIAAKEEGRIDDMEVHDLNGGMIDVSANVRLISAPEAIDPKTRPGTEASAKFRKLPSVPLKGAALSHGQYVINIGTTILLPYLPDPLARGVAFRGLPGATADGDIGGGAKIKKIPGSNDYVTLVSFGMAWPQTKPFMIRIVETTADTPPKWDGAVLTVFIHKATMARVHYSCWMEPGDTELMAIPAMITDGAKRDRAKKLGTLGSHWMLTPWRTMILTHAVQQPLLEPTFIKFDGTKPAIGSTHAIFRGNLSLSARSSGKVTLLAQWEEWVDDLTMNGPRRIKRQAHVLDQTVESWIDPRINTPEARDLPIPFPRQKPEDPATEWRHDFGDTHYRAVDYRMKATTRFREFMPIKLWSDPINQQQFDFWEPSTEAEQAELQKSIHRLGPKWPLDINNSARPDSPKVLYIIPTFGWERSEEPDLKMSRRCGGGLRVYLDRPWYSSGDGELLGVVINNSGAGGGGSSSSGGGSSPGGGMGMVEGLKDKIVKLPGGIGEMIISGSEGNLKGLVTEWGMDPIWKSAYPKPTPSLADFPLATETMIGLSLDELGSSSTTRVAVAGHPVEYDWQRQLWYCDIEVNTGESYYPFIRLALCRFQPKSLMNTHLSRVIQCDFVQIAPDRVAAVQLPEDKKVKVMVSGVAGENTFTVAGVDIYGHNDSSDKNPIAKHMNQSRRIVVTVEQGISGDTWTPVIVKDNQNQNVELAAELIPTKKVGDRIVWLNTLMLPEKPFSKGGSKRYRLNIREYELFEADPLPPDVIDIPEEQDPWVSPEEMRGYPSDVILPGGEVTAPGGEVTTPGGGAIKGGMKLNEGIKLDATTSGGVAGGVAGGAAGGTFPGGGEGGMQTMSYSTTIHHYRVIERIVYAETVEI